MKIQSPISHKIMGFFPHTQTIHARLSLWRLQSHAQSLLIGRITLPMHPNQDASAHASQLGCICPSRHIHMCISIHAHTHTTSTTVNLHVPTSMYPERVKSQKLQKCGFWSLRVEHCIRHVLLNTQSDRHIRCTYAH